MLKQNIRTISAAGIPARQSRLSKSPGSAGYLRLLVPMRPSARPALGCAWPADTRGGQPAAGLAPGGGADAVITSQGALHLRRRVRHLPGQAHPRPAAALILVHVSLLMLP